MADIFSGSDAQASELDYYDMFAICKLLDKAASEFNIDPVTSNKVWKHYFRGRAEAYRRFADYMKKVFKEIDQMCKTHDKDNPDRYSIAKFGDLLSVLRDNDDKMVKESDHESRLCTRLKINMRVYLDDHKDELILQNSEQQLSVARKNFLQQAKEVELKKDKYHKTAFKREKTEIKKGLAIKPLEVRNLSSRVEHLQQKVRKRTDKYKEAFEKLKDSRNTLKEKSYEYEKARESVDRKRADYILAQLRKYGTESKLKAGKFEAADFDAINTADIIRHREQMETICIKKMEKYQVGRNREELLEQVKRETEAEKQRKAKGEITYSSDDDSDDDINVNLNHTGFSRRKTPDTTNETPVFSFRSKTPETGTETTEETPVTLFQLDSEDSENDEDEVPHAAAPSVGASSNDGEVPGPSHVPRAGQEYLVVKSCRKQYASQLNLTKGKKVTLILPPNERGLAYGEKTGRIFGKKTKGYFPFDCVVPAS